jgi:hypothetical protein
MQRNIVSLRSFSDCFVNGRRQQIVPNGGFIYIYIIYNEIPQQRDERGRRRGAQEVSGEIIIMMLVVVGVGRLTE